MWFFFQQKVAISFIAFCKHLAICPLHFRRLFRVMCFYLLIDWSFEIGILICIGIIFWNLDSQLLFLKRKWWRTGSWWATSLLPLALFAYRGNGITSLRLNFRSSSGWRPSCKNNLILVADVLCLFCIVWCFSIFYNTNWSLLRHYTWLPLPLSIVVFVLKGLTFYCFNTSRMLLVLCDTAISHYQLI